MRSQTSFVFFIAVLCVSAVCLGHVAHGQDSAAKPDTQKPSDGEATIANKSLAEGVYEIDFRNSNFDQKLLAPLGHGSLYGLQLIRPEEKGLRITIPSSQGKDKPNVGFGPAFEIHGDFEITVSYEILAKEIPQPVVNPQGPFQGYGAGANLYIMCQKSKNSATLRRCVMTHGAEVVQTHWVIRDEKGRRPWASKLFAASSRSGSLRLARRGDTLHYFMADELNGEFVELHQAEKFGKDPIGMVRVEATTDGSPTTVIIRWRSLKVVADKLQPLEIPVLSKKGKE